MFTSVGEGVPYERMVWVVKSKSTGKRRLDYEYKKL